MKKSIEELKEIVTDGMLLKGAIKYPFIDPSTLDEMIIRRYPNNIIRIDGRVISWVDLAEILITSDYELQTPGEKENLFKKNTVRGGLRVAGPGKKLGRNPVDTAKKKIVKSFSLEPAIIENLNNLANYQGVSMSRIVSMLINDKFIEKCRNSDFVDSWLNE